MKTCLTALLALTLSLGLFAKNPDIVDVLTPYITPDMITLQPEADYAHYELVVTGPNNFVHREIFDGRHVPFFEIFDAAGMILPDGQYNFELRAAPHLSDDVKAVMEEARATGDESIIKALNAAGDMPQGFVFAGSVLVRDGAIVLADQPELIFEASDGRDDGAVPGTPIVTPEVTSDDSGVDSDDPDRDILQNDDVVVRGSLCVGLDCVSGENFNFDTIRLKENNTRIKFDDTSATSSFPSTDWQLTANESNNGGKNKFSIENITVANIPFTIEGGGNNNAIYVRDNGWVGFGTTTPGVTLQTTTGNSPALRLEQDGSAGFAAQAWDVAGNETNFFIRDVTNGGLIPFRIQPAAPNGSFYMAADGDIGIGTTTPDAPFEVSSLDGSSFIQVKAEVNASEAERKFLILNNIGGVGLDLIDSSGDGSTWTVQNTNPKTLKFSENANNFMQLNTTGDLHIEAADTPSMNLRSTAAGATWAVEGTAANTLKFSENANSFMQLNNTSELRLEGDSTPGLYVKSNAAGQANRQMLTLENEGGPIFSMRNNAANGGSGNIWNIISQGNDSLTFNATSNTGTEIIFSKTGDITALSFTPSSDVNLKENFEEVSTQDILERLVDMDITQWNFISEGEHVRHLGPMAQDFHVAFGLGATETGISTTDANGVAFASIQALHDLFARQQATINEKEARIQSLEARLAALEAKLQD